jgi:hypothetical protein
VLGRLIGDQECKFWLERHGPKAILVREFLQLEAKFEAFGGLPVNREFRFFSAGLHGICSHPYWPADAIEEYVDEEKYPKWRSDLAALQSLSPDKERLLMELANTAALAVSKSLRAVQLWSVDFAQDVTGKWWLIDMARMEESFHWPGCEWGKHA